MKEIEEACSSYPWDSKIPISFWRGSTTGATLTFTLNNFRNYPRYKLVYLSFLYPKIIDARFNFLTQVDEKLKEHLHKWGYIGNTLSTANHLRYKYQILIDGNTCAYTRAYWQLFSNCLIFKQTSNNIQWYYRLLKDGIHYIPIAWDCSDLPEKIQWAKKHDKEAQQIVENANQLARENLRLEDIYLYIYLLLTEYAKLQKF